MIDVFGEKCVEYDVNADGYFDMRDLVRLKARLAGNKKQSIKWRLMQFKTELPIQ